MVTVSLPSAQHFGIKVLFLGRKPGRECFYFTSFASLSIDMKWVDVVLVR